MKLRHWWKQHGEADKIVAYLFVETAMSISRANPKNYMRKQLELNGSCNRLDRNWTGRLKRTVALDIDIGGGERVAALNAFSQLAVSICKQL